MYTVKIFEGLQPNTYNVDFKTFWDIATLVWSNNELMWSHCNDTVLVLPPLSRKLTKEVLALIH